MQNSGTESAIEGRKFPIQAEVVADRAPILTMNAQHSLYKLGQWLNGGKKIYAHEIVDATFNGAPCKAVKFQVPDKRQPGHWLPYYLIIDHVELLESEPTTH